MDRPDFLKEKTQTVVIQPTPFCNINCRYCYLPARTSTQKMELTTLERILEAVFSSSLIADEITLVWHAGEPLVVPLDFYERAMELIGKYNKRRVRVTTAFQTNGTLITQAWCDFIQRRQVKISVSLDGPQHIHDQARVDRTGRGTFERAMRGIRLLQENGITPNVLMVLTAYALDYPDEIWQFFIDKGLPRFALNVEEVNGANRQSSLEAERDIERYKRFLERLLELRDGCEGEPPAVREITTAVRRIASLRGPLFTPENTPGAMLGFDYLGNVSTYASEMLSARHPRYGGFAFGNVQEGPLEELLARAKLREIDAEIQHGVERCRKECQYFSFCGGGSPINKLSENGTFDSTETMQCRLRIKATVDVVMGYLEGREDLLEYALLAR